MDKAAEEMFKRNAEKSRVAATDDTPLATLIITMDIKSGIFKVVGNVVKDKNLTVSLLVEALYRIQNGPTEEPTEVDNPKKDPPLIVH